MKVLRCLVSILALAAANLAGLESAPAATETQAPNLTVTLDIKSQSLSDALNEFAQQSGLQVLYRSGVGKGLTSPRLTGTFSTTDALEKLLANTSLEYEFVDARTIAIIAKGGKESRTAVPGVTTEASALDTQLRLAQTITQEMKSLQRIKPGKEKDFSKNQEPEGKQAIPEIVVDGSRTLNKDIRRTDDDAQPYIIFDRTAIERSGAINPEAFLRDRMTVSTAFNTANQTADVGGTVSRLALRGLGALETLILVDGRRPPTYSTAGTPQQADINGIPLSSIERIEVLPTTASGIFGGSATGGAINIVLRREPGLQSQLTYANTFDSDTAVRSINISGGDELRNEKTSWTFRGSYSDANDLLIGDRDFYERGLDHILANNPNAVNTNPNPPLGSTTNIRSSGGTPLSLKSGAQLSYPFTSVPPGYAGVASDSGAQLAARDGQYNLTPPNSAQAGGNQRGLLNTPTIASAAGTLRHAFTPALESYLDVSTSRHSSEVTVNNALGTFSLPIDAPSNPFNQAIMVTTPIYLLDQKATMRINTVDATVGMIAQLPRDWRLVPEYSWGRTRLKRVTPGSFFTAGATAAIRSGSLNVFRDETSLPADFSDFYLDPWTGPDSITTQRNASVKISGPFWSLPAGLATASTLVEQRQLGLGDYVQRMQTSPTNEQISLAPARSQRVRSAYLETVLPVVATRNALRGVQLLELQLAVRRDNYVTEGANLITLTNGVPDAPIMRRENRLHSTDPTISLRYKPTVDVVLRASYGTGFLPPIPSQLIPGSSSVVPAFYAPILNLRDPLRGNEFLGEFLNTSGGNPDLNPEQAESRSVGVIVKPRFISGLRISLDWTRIRKMDNITTVDVFDPIGLSDFILSAPARITRAPISAGDPYLAGRITAIDTSFVNIARSDIETYDLAFDYALNTKSGGILTFSAKATYLDKITTQTNPLSPVVDQTGVATSQSANLRWRSNGTVTYEHQNLVLAWTTRFYDGYWLNTAHSVVANQGSASVGSQTYHDLSASYKFNRNGLASSAVDSRSHLLSGVTLTIGVNNIFDTRPPTDVASLLSGRYYSPIGDPRLANYYMSLIKEF